VVFGVQKIFNLACGSFYALGAYVGVSAVGWYVSAGGPPALFIVPLALAGAAVGAVGLVVERGLLRFVYDRDETFQLLMTFAIVLMMEDAIRLTWGTAPRSTAGLYLTYGQLSLFSARPLGRRGAGLQRDRDRREPRHRAGDRLAAHPDRVRSDHPRHRRQSRDGRGARRGYAARVRQGLHPGHRPRHPRRRARHPGDG